MNKESLIKARDKILFCLTDVNIDILDRTELILNIYQFLDETKYEDNVKVLKKEQKK